MRRRLVLASAALVLTAAAVLSQQGGSLPASALDAKSRAEVIDALGGALQRTYVYPEKATAMEQALRAKLREGAYDAIEQRDQFAQRLTEDLREIAHDKHLRVLAIRPPQPPAGAGAGLRANPFGETKRLDGNVAYVEILTFGAQKDAAAEAVARTMSAAADAAALILDVRRNGGGSPEIVALISSYLFGDARVHLNSLYWRPLDRTDDFFTDPRVTGSKFGSDKPVFVLTSARTFSAAEEFTYNLQALKRATIVGETTGGGAHPGGAAPLPHGFTAFIPSGRAINPITKTNWEGTGVKPDVAVSADAALDAALKLAAKRDR
jgi:retinol-binding protein 3